jgi:hypothetical protein
MQYYKTGTLLTYEKDANDVALLRRISVVAQILEYLVAGQKDSCTTNKFSEPELEKNVALRRYWVLEYLAAGQKDTGSCIKNKLSEPELKINGTGIFAQVLEYLEAGQKDSCTTNKLSKPERERNGVLRRYWNTGTGIYYAVRKMAAQQQKLSKPEQNGVVTQVPIPY